MKKALIFLRSELCQPEGSAIALFGFTGGNGPVGCLSARSATSASEASRPLMVNAPFLGRFCCPVKVHSFFKDMQRNRDLEAQIDSFYVNIWSSKFPFEYVTPGWILSQINLLVSSTWIHWNFKVPRCWEPVVVTAKLFSYHSERNIHHKCTVDVFLIGKTYFSASSFLFCAEAFYTCNLDDELDVTRHFNPKKVVYFTMFRWHSFGWWVSQKAHIVEVFFGQKKCEQHLGFSQLSRTPSVFSQVESTWTEPRLDFFSVLQDHKKHTSKPSRNTHLFHGLGCSISLSKAVILSVNG